MNDFIYSFELYILLIQIIKSIGIAFSISKFKVNTISCQAETYIKKHIDK